MTRSNRSPAAAQAGSISAALPTSAMLTGFAGRGRRARPGQRLGRIVGQPVDVADLEATAGARLVDLDDDGDAVVHRHRQRLGAAHPAETGRQGHGPAQRPAEVLAGGLGERLVGALQDPLGPDVDPRPGGHLAVHHQAAPLELAEVLPGRPLADEVRVGDEDARRPRMGPQDADRLARLDEQRLVAVELAQLADDRVEGGPGPGGAPGPAVDDEVVGVLGDLRIEVVHEHPERGFLLPAAAGQLAAARGADRTGADGAGGLGRRSPSATGYCRRPAMTRSPNLRSPTAVIDTSRSPGKVRVVGPRPLTADRDLDRMRTDRAAGRGWPRRPPARTRHGRTRRASRCRTRRCRRPAGAG